MPASLKIKNRYNAMKQKIEIDYFYFTVLTSVCIPPCPPMRYDFWYKVIDVYYDILEPQERAHLYDTIIRCSVFTDKNEDCALFAARYNPDNQYMVSATDGLQSRTLPCFKWKDKYYTKSNMNIVPEYITKIEKIDPNIF